MEVFMRNVPRDITEEVLRQCLRPCLEKLSITNYVCEKHRNKPIAFVIFSEKADGDKFLARHGEVLSSSSKEAESRLSIMGRRVFCKLSTRPVAVNEGRIKQMKTAKTQRPTAARVEQPPVVDSQALLARDFSCGHHLYVDGSLTFVSEWTTGDRDSHIVFNKRNICIKLPTSRIEVRISYQSIIELMWSTSGSVAVTLSLPPVILEDDLSVMMSMLGLYGSRHQQQPQLSRLAAIDDRHAKISSFCLVYYFKLVDVGYRYSTEIRKLKGMDSFYVTQYNVQVRQPHTLRHGSSSNKQSYSSFDQELGILRHRLGNYDSTRALPYGILFLLQALAYNGYLHPCTVCLLADRLVADFGKARASGSKQDPVSVEAFKKLFQVIDYPSPHWDAAMFEVDWIMQELYKAEKLFRQGSTVRSELFGETSNLVRIFRVTVTPMRITLHGPEMEAKNRVLRKFPDHQEHFVRAQFCDENGQDLFGNAKMSLEHIYSRFKSVLSNGIPIAGRTYNFLGFSHSSLRAHSLWLYTPFMHEGKLQMYENIITGLGRFEQIRSPARRAARIGQAFSETPYAISLKEHGITAGEIADVTRNGRVFSDGVGTISWDAVEAIYSVIPESKGWPTCFQIRFGGAKGMLSLDSRLEGNVILIRDSMKKFESLDVQNLEICDVAWRPIPLVLNRQMIKILEDMGAPFKWFSGLQERELGRLRAITESVYNTAEFLRTQSICQALRLHRFLVQTEEMGLDYRHDPFLSVAIDTILLRELRLLKHKARIPVEKGITLFGVMDETGFLGEGQVYVIFDTMRGRFADPPTTGIVLVTRSPALHPGDVQIAMNVIPPEGHPLRELRNCLVFSQKGDRDLPSQLSGGDLDGDIFNVIWDEQLVYMTRLTTYPAADYPRKPPLELHRPVEAKDMAQFFVDFIKTDCLGLVAIRHMILADQGELGTLEADCQKLAAMHSDAVDFSKTGHPVDPTGLPKAGRFGQRPDFLAPPGSHVVVHKDYDISLDEYLLDDDEDAPRHRYYESSKTLGHLFRAVDEKSIWKGNRKAAASKSKNGPPFWDELLACLARRAKAMGVSKWSGRVSDAQHLRHAYEDAIWGVMTDCSEHPYLPLKEIEVVTGHMLNKTGIQTTRQRDKSFKIKDEFDRIAAWIIRQIRKPTAEDGSHRGELDALELCMACVEVGLGRTRPPRQEQYWNRAASRDIESFKLVAAVAAMREINSLEVRHADTVRGEEVRDLGRGSTRRERGRAWVSPDEDD